MMGWRERGRRKSKRGEVRRDEGEGGQQERARTRWILNYIVLFISVSLQFTVFLLP